MSPLASLAAAVADRYRIEREIGAGGMATDDGLRLLDVGAASDEGFVAAFCKLIAWGVRGQSVPPLDEATTAPLRVDPHGSQIIAEAYAAGGNHAEALSWVRNAIALGVTNADYMVHRSPFLASLRGDSDFEALAMAARARFARENGGRAT
jgi:hypothetical protein